LSSALFTKNFVILFKYNCKKLGAVGELNTLKVWKFSSERDLIKSFLEDLKFFEELFTFIPVGVNLLFDLLFIYSS